MADKSTVKELTDKLEAGVKDLFEGDKYSAYLKTMSRFHNYSTRNIQLIHLQMPGATRVAGYNSWKNKFGRQVKGDEKGIRIFAPIKFSTTKEFEKLDPVTKKPVLDENGQPVMETLVRTGAKFKVVYVYDISQTDGEPLLNLAEPLTGNVERYELFMDALREVSPLPIVFEDLPPDIDGICRFGDRISIRNGMSEVQAVSAVIHEMAHAKLHDLQTLQAGSENPKDRRTEEVEAESISYVISQHYGIETGANSFGYIAEWSRGKELKELNASLDTIRKASTELLGGIDARYYALAKERGIDLSIEAPVSEPSANDLYAKYCNIIADKAAQYAASSGTLSRTDEIEARRSTTQIVNRVVDDLLLGPDGGEHYALHKEYVNNPDFKARLEDYVFIKAEFERVKTDEPVLGDAKKKAEHQLYEKLAEMFQDFMNQKYSYLRLESKGFEPLSLEWVFGDCLSIMHTYELNGDLCYDPMIEFTVNSFEKTLKANVFQQSIPPLYQFHDDEGIGRNVDGNGNEREIKNLRSQLHEFSTMWFQNISEQGFMPVQATLWNEGRVDDVDIRVTFDKDGNIIMPETEKEDAPIQQADTGGTDHVFGLDMPPPKPTVLDMSLPDSTISSFEMNAYGYTEPDMHPLSEGRAIELFNTDHTIYLLYPDNTELVALDRDEIITFSNDGICGITHADWEISPVRAAQISAAAEPPAQTVSQLESEVKAGKSISVMDLAKAAHAERKPPVSKGKPSLLAQLEEAKKQIEQNRQLPAAGVKKDWGIE